MRGERKIKSAKSFLRRAIMKCLCSGDQLRADGEIIRGNTGSSRNDCSGSGYSSRNGNLEREIISLENGTIEEAESSLREGVCLNNEEARALLGRLEYQRGNLEAAIRVFEGIDIPSNVPKMKISISRRIYLRKPISHWDEPPLPLHAVSLLIESLYLKSRALHDLSRFAEAAQECNTIVEIFESALPEGFPPVTLGPDCKLHEILSKTLEFLPELHKLSNSPRETLVSYRRALLNRWNLDPNTIAKIQKEFAIFLLYGGWDANPPDLRSQMDSSFVPQNNLEESILLLMILFRKMNLKKIEWDPSIIQHLTFALSVSGQFKSLAVQYEELLPSVTERSERLYTLALCYLGERDDLTALNLLQNLLTLKEEREGDHNFVRALLLASKICGERPGYAERGMHYAHWALATSTAAPGGSRCNRTDSIASYLLGVSLSAQARVSPSDSERARLQREALNELEFAEKRTNGRNYNILFNLSLEYAEQRKLDLALKYAKKTVKLENGSRTDGWILLARILSAQRRFADAESVINAGLDQTGKWDQGDLLRTKAKIQIVKGDKRKAVETYTHLLAVIQLRTKSFSAGMKFLKGVRNDRSLEMETWHDLSRVYLSMSQWRDSEICLSKINSINPYSPLFWHASGQLYEAKGLVRDALNAYTKALDVDPTHVPSMVSMAQILRQLGDRPLSAVRSFLTDALRLDRTNHVAWFNLGLLYQSEGATSALEAAECFQAAAVLEETAPVEPFR